MLRTRRCHTARDAEPRLGIATFFIDEPAEGACPEPAEGACPEPAEGACPEPAEGACPEPAEGACPEPAEGACPEPAEGACPEPAEGACPEPAEGACPEPAEGACPEPAEGACPEPAEGACPGQPHVPRLQVTVHDTFVVGELQTPAGLDGNGDGLLQRNSLVRSSSYKVLHASTGHHWQDHAGVIPTT